MMRRGASKAQRGAGTAVPTSTDRISCMRAPTGTHVMATATPAGTSAGGGCAAEHRNALGRVDGSHSPSSPSSPASSSTRPAASPRAALPAAKAHPTGEQGWSVKADQPKHVPTHLSAQPMHTCTSTYARVHAHTLTHTHAHTRSCTHAPAHATHARTHIHTHTHILQVHAQ